MIVKGEHTLSAPPQAVWEALHDVDILRNTVPGCEELEQTAPDEFSGVASVGIALIKGTYRGKLRIIEQKEPSFARIRVEARSGHAEIKGEGRLNLEPAGAGTVISYEGEASVSGPLAGVGQRLLPSASKSLIDRFFRSLDEWLATYQEEEASA